MSFDSIVLSVIMALALCRSIFILVNAIGIARAIRRGQSIQCCAVIVAEHGRISRNILFSTWYAKAQYNMESKQVVGEMLSPVYERMLESQKIEIFVNRHFPKVFALSQKHARDTLVKYIIFSAFWGIGLLGKLAFLF